MKKTAQRERDVDEMALRQHDRLARHAAVSFRKAMTEPVKVIAPMAAPSAISTRLAPCPMVADRADAEGCGA
jgi:hypothetical protein